MINKPFALYLHFPFCEGKCNYCDFYSLSFKKENRQKEIKQYIKALKTEISIYNKKLSCKKIKTIFFGGGTPSLMSPDQLFTILKTIRNKLFLEDNIEISLEANPSSLTEYKIKEYYKMGINRLSLGVQSLNNKELKFLGRNHTATQALDIMQKTKKVFNNYNIDLIFAIPGQKREDWQLTLNKVLKVKPPHISMYNLQIEEETPLFNRVKKGIIRPVSEETDADMYLLARKKLLNNNYNHYEISNFSLDNFACQHNKVYWHYQPYLGLGPSAHSFSGKKRFFNYKNLNKYINLLKNNKLPVFKEINLNKKDLYFEKMMMGLRLLEGVSRKEFKIRFKVSLDDLYHQQIKKLSAQGLLVSNDHRIFLTEKGLLLGNYVFRQFII